MTNENNFILRVATVAIAAIIVFAAIVFITCYEIEWNCPPRGACEVWVHW